MRTFAERVLGWLAAAGFPPDDKGAVASSPLFARSIEGWEEAAHAWVEHPDRNRGLMLFSVAVESDPVWGTTAAAERLAAALARSPQRAVHLLPPPTPGAFVGLDVDVELLPLLSLRIAQ
jgi:signal-transduction protein with cAMP-binding, CBS, and nucleotidyltransferase domain